MSRSNKKKSRSYTKGPARHTITRSIYRNPMIELLASALIAQTQLRQGDIGTVTAPLPILPGGRVTDAVVHCNSFILVQWRRPDGSWFRPFPNRYLWDHSVAAQDAARRACSRQP